jgi:hypothetical protein
MRKMQRTLPPGRQFSFTKKFLPRNRMVQRSLREGRSFQRKDRGKVTFIPENFFDFSRETPLRHATSRLNSFYFL